MIMVGVFALVFAGLFVIVLALLAALVMERASPELGVFARSAAAALMAGFLPVIPAALYVSTDETSPGFLDIFLLLLIAGFILSAVCFPAAFLFSRRRARKRSEPVNLETFE